ncbi:unnamed protein product [Clonostachys byssicola]|uniref:Thioredoxin domain-containing protein n=1 Tax=Clonostachys byssicola TaxID=160290 RepID=A0A9N9XYE5_9HYPO|nr:unnamed protein product [Clonostachys byssicola]
MPILKSFSLPDSESALPVVQDKPLFVVFLSPDDPETKQPWCSDVRAALPLLNQTFSGPSSPEAAYIEVGPRPEYKKPDNYFRTKWNIHNIPTVVRYELRDGKVQEIGRLIENEVIENNNLQSLVSR